MRWTRLYKEAEREDSTFMAYQDSVEVHALMASRFRSEPKYKFGLQVPNSARHAIYLDKLHGNNLWRLAIEKEIREINSFGTFR